MKLTEITPIFFRCGLGACPAIFETSNGNYVLIGKKIPQTIDLPELAGRIGPDETAVEIPRGLIADLAVKKV